MRRLLIVLFAALGLSNAAAASTVTVEAAGFEWEVSLVLTNFVDGEALLESQVWWEDEALATEFAEAVGLGFGVVNTPTSPTLGPYFAYEDSGWAGISLCRMDATSSVGCVEGFSATQARYFATAEMVAAVPLPASGMLLLSAFGVVALRRSRKSV